MTNTSGIWLFLRPQEDLKVFVTGSGLDVFVPAFIWPETPEFTEIDKTTLITDLRITKKLFIRNNENCEDTRNYKYSGKCKYARIRIFLPIHITSAMIIERLLDQVFILYCRLHCKRVSRILQKDRKHIK